MNTSPNRVISVRTAAVASILVLGGVLALAGLAVPAEAAPTYCDFECGFDDYSLTPCTCPPGSSCYPKQTVCRNYQQGLCYDQYCSVPSSGEARTFEASVIDLSCLDTLLSDLQSAEAGTAVVVAD